ncbi:MAG TPA: hypothetical protein VGH74_11205, partial [Planctomycetaceae bacterium]
MRGRQRRRRSLGGLLRWSKNSGQAAAACDTAAGSSTANDSGLRIVLWDTRHGGAFKDFAGGFGVGQFTGTGLRSKIIEHFYRSDFRSPPLAYGYLAAGLAKLGHKVEYCLEDTPAADVYIFNPALMTFPHELEVIRRLNAKSPKTKILVVGTVASTMPTAFADVDCKVVSG